MMCDLGDVIARSQRVRANARPDDRLRDDVSAAAQRAKAEAIQIVAGASLWIASRSLSSGRASRGPVGSQ